MTRIGSALTIVLVMCLLPACRQLEQLQMMQPTSAACTLTVSPVVQEIPREGGVFHVTVTGPCDWTATSEEPWIVITYGSGADLGTVRFEVSPNPGLEPREGRLRINDVPLTVVQAGLECRYEITPDSFEIDASSASYEARLETHEECPWSATPGESWVELETTSGTGPAVVEFSVRANTGDVPRKTSIRIGDQSIRIVQAAPEPVECTFTLAVTPPSLPASGGSATLTVTTLPECEWSSSSPDSWIAAVSGPRTGSGTVAVMVSANSGPARTGRIDVSGDSIASITLSQAAFVCTFVLEVTPNPVPPEGGGGSLQVTTAPGCAWSSSSPDFWISAMSGPQTGSGAVAIGFDPNEGPPRTGRIDVGTASVTVMQEAFPVTECSFDVIVSPNPVPVGGGTGSLEVFTDPGCEWSSSTTAEWIRSANFGPVTGSNSFELGFDPNETGEERSAIIQVGPVMVVVTQEASGTGANLIGAPARHPWTRPEFLLTARRRDEAGRR